MIEGLSAYFESIPSWHRTLILAGGLTLFWMIEGLIPIVRFNYNKGKHALVNLFFTFTSAIVNLLFAFLILKASDQAVAGGWGVIQWVELPLVIELLIALLILDLVGAYFIHWLEHRFHWLWKFHIIHHSDTHVDSTTALRHHPGESVFRATFTLLAVFITGAPIWMVMLYQSFSAFLSQFNHANIVLPRWIELLLSWCMVTPRMHRVHHHEALPHTDANYGNIFSFWDKIFGTYAELSPDDIVYGLDVFDKRESNMGDLLGLPFDGLRYKLEQDD